jgi:hypothetical protein
VHIDIIADRQCSRIDGNFVCQKIRKLLNILMEQYSQLVSRVYRVGGKGIKDPGQRCFVMEAGDQGDTV